MRRRRLLNLPLRRRRELLPDRDGSLPVSSWDRTYIAVEAGRFGLTGEPRLDERTVQIVANEDGTEVTMRPGEASSRAGASISRPPACP